MPEEEVIITRFEADITDLEGGIRKAAGLMDDYSEAAKDAGKSTDDLSAKTGNLSQRVLTTIAAEQKAIKTTQDLSNAQKAASGSSRQLAADQGKVADAVKQTSSGTRGLNVFQRVLGNIRSGFGRAVQGMKDLKDNVVRGFREITGGGGAGGLPPILGKIKDGFGSAAGGAGKFAGSLRGLVSPIGLVAAAVGGLILNFGRLDSVQDKIAKVKAGFQSFLDSLAGNASLSTTISGIEKAVELAERLDTLNTDIVANSVQNTADRARAAELRREAENRALATEKRVELLAEANTLLERASQIEVDERAEEARIAYEDLVRVVQQQNDWKLTEQQRELLNGFDTLNAEAAKFIRQLDSDGFEISEDAFANAAKAVNNLVSASTDYTNLQTTNINKIDLLQKQAAEEEERRREKALAEQRKREAERLKFIEERIAAEQKVADILREIQDIEIRRGLSEREQEKFDVDQDVERQIRLIEEQIAVQEKSARATISNSRELATELERIEADKQNAIFIITQDGNARRLAIDQKFNLQEVAAAEDARDSIIDYLRTDLERQEAEIEQNYRDQLELAEKFITDEDELAQIRIALKKKRDGELAELTRKATEELTEEEEKRIGEYKKITERFFTDGTASLVSALSGQTSAINAQYQQQLADLATFNGSEEELQLERERILAERNAALLEQQSSFSKELIILLLDALEKVVQIAAAEALVSTIADGATKGGLAGALAGAATGAIIQGLIKGIFATVKGAVAGAYYGEEYVSGKEVFPGEKDSYIRRVHKGERIVTAEKNQRYRAPLHAIHEGKFEQFIETNYVLPRISAYLQSDTGKRTTDSVMLAKYYDANIVGALHKSMKLQQETNAILARSISARSGRYW